MPAPEFALMDRVKAAYKVDDDTLYPGTIRAIRTEADGSPFFVVLFDAGGSAGRTADHLVRI